VNEYRRYQPPETAATEPPANPVDQIMKRISGEPIGERIRADNKEFIARTIWVFGRIANEDESLIEANRLKLKLQAYSGSPAMTPGEYLDQRTQIASYRYPEEEDRAKVIALRELNAHIVRKKVNKYLTGTPSGLTEDEITHATSIAGYYSKLIAEENDPPTKNRSWKGVTPSSKYL
jgi:hypothetical protein